jgi:hypothetical protein
MTTVLLIVVGLGFAPLQFASINACEQAWRDMFLATNWTERHWCAVVRTRLITKEK